jgi:hypothetical protein
MQDHHPDTEQIRSGPACIIVPPNDIRQGLPRAEKGSAVSLSRELTHSHSVDRRNSRDRYFWARERRPGNSRRERPPPFRLTQLV